MLGTYACNVYNVYIGTIMRDVGLYYRTMLFTYALSRGLEDLLYPDDRRLLFTNTTGHWKSNEVR